MLDVSNILTAVKELQRIFKDCKSLAERLGNDFVSEHHFLFVYNKYRAVNKPDFKVSFSVQKESLKSLKKIKKLSSSEDKPNLYLLSKELDNAVKSAKLQRRIFGDKLLEPKHIYISLLISNGLDKSSYMDILSQFKVKINRINTLLIALLYSSFLSKSGLLRLIF